MSAAASCHRHTQKSFHGATALGQIWYWETDASYYQIYSFRSGQNFDSLPAAQEEAEAEDLDLRELFLYASVLFQLVSFVYSWTDLKWCCRLKRKMTLALCHYDVSNLIQQLSDEHKGEQRL